MTDETLSALVAMFQQLLRVANVQIVNVHIGGVAYSLTIWQAVVTGIFFTIVVRLISGRLSEGRGDSDG